MFKYLALFAFVACGIQAQKIYIGGCPKVNVEENFDLNRYLGVWYEVEKYHEEYEITGKCQKSVWSVQPNGNISVHKQWINEKSGAVVNGGNNPKFVGEKTEAKFILENPDVPFGAPYWILETDYDNYAVVWSCTDIFQTINIRFAWILTRSRTPSDNIINKAHAVFDRYNLTKKLEKADQSDCPEEI